MGMARVAFIAGFSVLALRAAPVAPGDSDRGAELFQRESCILCHSINGKGGTIAPDLGKRIGRDFTPSRLASLMWNHAPTMWAAFERRGITKPRLSEQAAADLFAFFYSTRFFDKPGDAGRGKRLFAEKHCGDCHGITSSSAAGAPPVAKWEALGHPIILAQQMWNHAAQMRAALASRNIAWPRLETQELTDIQVYLMNLPETRHLAGRFFYLPTESGQPLFHSKGCVKCHFGKLALEGRLKNSTLTDIAVAMWNHAPQMIQPPPAMTQDEMRRIVSYIWVRQFLEPPGNAGHGRRVFVSKKCVVCHEDPFSGAPNLATHKATYSDLDMIAVLWQHGPQMLERMRQKNVPWPRFETDQMTDLIAYLNSLK